MIRSFLHPQLRAERASFAVLLALLLCLRAVVLGAPGLALHGGFGAPLCAGGWIWISSDEGEGPIDAETHGVELCPLIGAAVEAPAPGAFIAPSAPARALLGELKDGVEIAWAHAPFYRVRAPPA